MTKIWKKLIKNKWLNKYKPIQRWILLNMNGNRIPYTQIKNSTSRLYLDYFQVENYHWSKERRDKYIHDKSIFNQRLNQASNGILQGLDSPNIVLGGGSLVTLLQKDADLTSNFDLDIFIVRTPSMLDDIYNTLCHFEKVAKTRQVQVHYIIRGLLIEVLIPNERQTQIICTKYTTPQECFYCVDLTYVQVYYDWNTVNASYLAMDAFRTGNTKCVKVPLKRVRRDKTNTKGYSINPPCYVTEVDVTYDKLIQRVQQVKSLIDNDPTNKLYDDSLHLFHDAETCFENVVIQLQYRWNVLRWLHHASYHLYKDMDIFDHMMRLNSYLDSLPVLVEKRIQCKDTQKSIMGVELDKEIIPIILFTLQLQVTSCSQDTVKVIADEDLLFFLQHINALLETPEQQSVTDTVSFNYNSIGSRCYDHVERPCDLPIYSTNVQVSISFVVLVENGTPIFEIIDIFIAKIR